MTTTINKDLYFAKTKTAIIAISKENPELFIVAEFSKDGEKVKNSNFYTEKSKAKFYAEKGNNWIFSNGEIL